MFWFVFILIILFIIFLIVLLISSTQVSVPRRRENIKRRDKKEPKVKKSPAKPKKKVKEVTSPKEEHPVVTEEVVEPIVEVEPTVEPEAPIAVPTPEPIIEEVPEPETTTVVEEEVTPEAPTLEPFIAEEAFDEPEVVEVDTVAVADVEVAPEPVVEDTYNYATFDNTRTMEEFGLSREEANDFILDLITQVEEELVNLEAAVEAHDTKKIEDISHMIKGSATNLGTGGIADVLVDFNTYMKSASEPEVIASHMRNLHRAYDELKTQFS